MPADFRSSRPTSFAPWNGFSMVELSVVLVVISVAVGSLLTIATNKTEADKVTQTERQLDKIEAAVAAYIAQYKRLPCPADASLASAVAGFGVATRDSGSITQCTGSSTNWYASAVNPSLELGSVPTKALQIPDEYAYDAWGRRITYIMVETCNTDSTEHATIHFSSDTYCGNSSTPSAITLRNAGAGTITSEAVLVLISHGPNGHGAYSHSGGTTRINYYNGSTADTDEVNNSDLLSNGTSQVSDNVYVQKSTTATFDDIVRYKTKSQLIRDAGGLKGWLTAGVTQADSIASICTVVDSNVSIGKIPTQVVADAICGNTPGNASCGTYLYTLATQIRAMCF